MSIMAEDIVRVLRIYEFLGPRSAVEQQVARSIHGTRSPGAVAITGVSLDEFPKMAEEREAVLMKEIRHLEEELAAERDEGERVREIVQERNNQLAREQQRIIAGNIIEFDGDDWGGNCAKADTPGKEFTINGVKHTLYGVGGSENTWDGQPLLVMKFRREQP